MEITSDHQQTNKKFPTLFVFMMIIGSLMVTNVSSDNTDVNFRISGLGCIKPEDQLLRELSGSHLRLSASHVSIA